MKMNECNPHTQRGRRGWAIMELPCHVPVCHAWVHVWESSDTATHTPSVTWHNGNVNSSFLLWLDSSELGLLSMHAHIDFYSWGHNCLDTRVCIVILFREINTKNGRREGWGKGREWEREGGREGRGGGLSKRISDLIYRQCGWLRNFWWFWIS